MWIDDQRHPGFCLYWQPHTYSPYSTWHSKSIKQMFKPADCVVDSIFTSEAIDASSHNNPLFPTPCSQPIRARTHAHTHTYIWLSEKVTLNRGDCYMLCRALWCLSVCAWFVETDSNGQRGINYGLTWSGLGDWCLQRLSRLTSRVNRT